MQHINNLDSPGYDSEQRLFTRYYRELQDVPFTKSERFNFIPIDNPDDSKESEFRPSIERANKESLARNVGKQNDLHDLHVDELRESKQSKHLEEELKISKDSFDNGLEGFRRVQSSENNFQPKAYAGVRKNFQKEDHDDVKHAEGLEEFSLCQSKLISQGARDKGNEPEAQIFSFSSIGLEKCPGQEKTNSNKSMTTFEKVSQYQMSRSSNEEQKYVDKSEGSSVGAVRKAELLEGESCGKNLWEQEGRERKDIISDETLKEYVLLQNFHQKQEQDTPQLEDSWERASRKISQEKNNLISHLKEEENYQAGASSVRNFMPREKNTEDGKSKSSNEFKESVNQQEDANRGKDVSQNYINHQENIQRRDILGVPGGTDHQLNKSRLNEAIELKSDELIREGSPEQEEIKSSKIEGRLKKSKNKYQVREPENYYQVGQSGRLLDIDLGANNLIPKMEGKSEEAGEKSSLREDFWQKISEPKKCLSEKFEESSSEAGNLDLELSKISNKDTPISEQYGRDTQSLRRKDKKEDDSELEIPIGHSSLDTSPPISNIEKFYSPPTASLEESLLKISSIGKSGESRRKLNENFINEKILVGRIIQNIPERKNEEEDKILPKIKRLDLPRVESREVINQEVEAQNDSEKEKLGVLDLREKSDFCDNDLSQELNAEHEEKSAMNMSRISSISLLDKGYDNQNNDLLEIFELLNFIVCMIATNQYLEFTAVHIPSGTVFSNQFTNEEVLQISMGLMRSAKEMLDDGFRIACKGFPKLSISISDDGKISLNCEDTIGPIKRERSKTFPLKELQLKPIDACKKYITLTSQMKKSSNQKLMNKLFEKIIDCNLAIEEKLEKLLQKIDNLESQLANKHK